MKSTSCSEKTGVAERHVTTLEERSQAFAQEVQDTLDNVLPGQREIVALRAEGGGDRYLVQPRDRQRIAIYVDGEALAELLISFYLDLDRTDQYLKTVRSDLKLYSLLDRQPLLRLEYRADMHSDPISHWQFHAERGAFSQLLARAHARDPNRVSKPHDLSTVHLPVGGERFRPCLEDFLQLLVVDCGVDSIAGWEQAVESGRETWRRRQLMSAVRDLPSTAAAALSEAGWTCTAPAEFTENVGPIKRW
jgi:hypothetical protein